TFYNRHNSAASFDAIALQSMASEEFAESPNARRQSRTRGIHTTNCGPSSPPTCLGLRAIATVQRQGATRSKLKVLKGARVQISFPPSR
ncbi:MAG: hypothetical protein WCK55_22230, partial [Verrucomicrobiota bacterium]